jgi:hypothetical protein
MDDDMAFGLFWLSSFYFKKPNKEVEPVFKGGGEGRVGERCLDSPEFIEVSFSGNLQREICLISQIIIWVRKWSPKWLEKNIILLKIALFIQEILKDFKYDRMGEKNASYTSKRRLISMLSKNLEYYISRKQTTQMKTDELENWTEFSQNTSD